MLFKGRIKKMKIKERIGRLKKRTKIVWCIGLIVIVLGVLSILILPPPGCYGNVCIKGTVIERGVLTTGDEILCVGDKCGNFSETKINSYSIKVEKVYSGDVKVGDKVKVDEAGELEIGKTYKLMYYPSILKLKEKGSILWDSQSRKLKDFLVGTYQRNFYLGFPTQLPEGNPLLFYSIPLTIILFFTLLWAIKESFITKLLTTLFVMLAVMPAITLPVPYDLIPFLSIPIEIIAILFAIKLRGKYKGVSHKSSD